MAKRKSTHPGVTVRALARGRYRIRWRERIEGGDTAAQSWTTHCDDPGQAEEWAIRIHRSVIRDGVFDRPDDVGTRPTPPSRPQEIDLRELWVAWAAWRLSHQGVRAGTARTDRECLTSAEREIRAIHRLRDNTPIPLAVLTTPTCEAVVQRLAARGNGSARISGVMGTIYRSWVWACDDGEARWPGLLPAPRTRSKVVPARKDPPTALPPTIEEMDALVRAAHHRPRASTAGDVLEIMRATGLRISQVCALEVRDVEGLRSRAPRLQVRTGKSAAEARGRVVPVSPCLVPLLKQRCRGQAPEALLVPSRPGTTTLQRIAQECVQQGLVRPDVIQPRGRRNRRVSHYMRAGLQRHLRREGVEDRVIDVIVGHAGATVRDRHYDRADWGELVDAVGRIPPVSEAAPGLTSAH
jgi:integrase